MTELQNMNQKTDLEASSNASTRCQCRMTLKTQPPSKIAHAILMGAIFLYTFTMDLIFAVNYIPKTSMERRIIAQAPFVVLTQLINVMIGYITMVAGWYNKTATDSQARRARFGFILQYFILMVCFVVQIVVATDDT